MKVDIVLTDGKINFLIFNRRYCPAWSVHPVETPLGKLVGILLEISDVLPHPQIALYMLLLAVQLLVCKDGEHAYN